MSTWLIIKKVSNGGSPIALGFRPSLRDHDYDHERVLKKILLKICLAIG